VGEVEGCTEGGADVEGDAEGEGGEHVKQKHAGPGQSEEGSTTPSELNASPTRG